VQTGTKLVVGLGVLGVGGLVWWQRQKVKAAATTLITTEVRVAQAVAKGVTAPARAVVAKVKQLTCAGLRSADLKRIYQYGLHRLAETHRGLLPWSVAMAIMEHESHFDPTIYNYSGGDCTKKLCVGHWTGPGSRKAKGGANGLFQIMSHLIGVKGGYDLATVDEAFDPEKNVRAGLKALNAGFKKYLQPYGITDPVLIATLVYMGNAEGWGAVQKALKGAKDSGSLVWSSIQTFWKFKNRVTGIAEVGARAALWAACQDKILSGDLHGLTQLGALDDPTGYLTGPCALPDELYPAPSWN